MRFLKGTSWGQANPPSSPSTDVSCDRSWNTAWRCIFSAKSLVQPLIKIQNEALRLCMGAMRSTPTLCLQHACKEMPLDLKHQLLCSKYKANLLTFPTHPAKSIIEDCWQECFPDSANFCSFNMLTKSTITGDLLRANVLRTFDSPPWLLHLPLLDFSVLNFAQHSGTTTVVPFFCPLCMRTTVGITTFIPMVQKQLHLRAVAFTLNSLISASRLQSTRTRRPSVQNCLVFFALFIVSLSTQYQTCWSSLTVSAHYSPLVASAGPPTFSPARSSSCAQLSQRLVAK